MWDPKMSGVHLLESTSASHFPKHNVLINFLATLFANVQ